METEHSNAQDSPERRSVSEPAPPIPPGNRKILGAAVLIAVLSLGWLMRSALSPLDGIQGISQEKGKNYREWIVLRTDGTFEQIVQDNRTQMTFCNHGTWIQASDDPETRLFLARTETKVNGSYFDLKNEVEVPDPLTPASWHAPAGPNSALLPGISFNPPDSAQLRMIEALCKNAVPMR